MSLFDYHLLDNSQIEGIRIEGRENKGVSKGVGDIWDKGDAPNSGGCTEHSPAIDRITADHYTCSQCGGLFTWTPIGAARDAPNFPADESHKCTHCHPPPVKSLVDRVWTLAVLPTGHIVRFPVWSQSLRPGQVDMFRLAGDVACVVSAPGDDTITTIEAWRRGLIELDVQHLSTDEMDG